MALRVTLLAVLLLGIAAAVVWGLADDAAETQPDAPAPDAYLAGSKIEGTRLGRWPIEEFYLEHDLFPPLTDPRTESAAAATWLQPRDEVIGVLVKDHARAYPITMLSYHHVANDVIHGIPIAVTY